MADVKPWQGSLREEELRRGIELMFFAYRDFTGEADSILAEQNMGGRIIAPFILLVVTPESMSANFDNLADHQTKPITGLVRPDERRVCRPKTRQHRPASEAAVFD